MAIFMMHENIFHLFETLISFNGFINSKESRHFNGFFENEARKSVNMVTFETNNKSVKKGTQYFSCQFCLFESGHR